MCCVVFALHSSHYGEEEGAHVDLVVPREERETSEMGEQHHRQSAHTYTLTPVTCIATCKLRCRLLSPSPTLLLCSNSSVIALSNVTHSQFAADAAVYVSVWEDREVVKRSR